MPYRDENVDSSRTDGPADRRSKMIDMDFRVGTLAEEKMQDPNSVGTASDYRGVTDHIHDFGGVSITEDGDYDPRNVSSS